MRIKTVAIATIISLLAAGCASDQGGKQILGSLAGAGAGAFAGSKIGKGDGKLAATAGGALLGALLMGEVGKSLDHADQVYDRSQRRPARRSAESWADDDEPRAPVARHRSMASGPVCREYEQEIMVNGTPRKSYGTACREPDGSWRVVN